MDQFDLVVRGGTVVTAADTARADVGIRRGKIAAVGNAPAQGRDGGRARGPLVLPPGVHNPVPPAHPAPAAPTPRHQAEGGALVAGVGLRPRGQAGAARMAAIGAEGAEVTQAGRGRQTGSGKWTDDRIRELHEKYETRGSQTAKAFAKQHSIDRSYMYQRFRSLGLLY